MLGPQQGDGCREQLEGGGIQHHKADHAAAGVRPRALELLHFPHGFQTRGDCCLSQPQQIGSEIHGDGAHGRAVRGQVREKPPGNGQQSLTQCPGQAALDRHLHGTRPEAESAHQPQHERNRVTSAGEKGIRKGRKVPLQQGAAQSKGSHTGKQYGHHCVSPAPPLIDPPKKNDAYLYVFKNFNIPLINFQTLFIYFG